jgi:hypothetical protein
MSWSISRRVAGRPRKQRRTMGQLNDVSMTLNCENSFLQATTLNYRLYSMSQFARLKVDRNYSRVFRRVFASMQPSPRAFFCCVVPPTSANFSVKRALAVVNRPGGEEHHPRVHRAQRASVPAVTVINS